MNDFKSDVSGFIAGAKSPESLEYWKGKEKLYTEEEVIELLNDFFYNHVNKQTANIDMWFNQNKKK